MMKLLTVVAVAAMGLTACQNSFDEQTNVGVNSSVTINFISNEARTSVDTSGDTPLFSWDEDETFVVLEQTDALAKALSVEYTKVDGKANISAEFAVNAGKDTYKYLAIYPESAYVLADNINEATLILPELQVMYSEDSYDPNADLMVSMPVETSAQPTEVQPLRFTRLAAIAKMTIKNLPEGEQIEKVEFTANGKNLAGSVITDLENPEVLIAKECVSTVSVATTSTDVYFTVLPTTLEAGDSYSVVVVTNKQLYIKQGTISEGKLLEFKAGMVTRFSANLTDEKASEKWVLVRDASTLADGDIVTIAASDLNYVMGKMGSQYAYASYTEVVKVRDYLHHPVTVAGTTSGDNVLQQLTIVKSDKANAFHLYNGEDFSKDSYTGYVCTYTSNNYLKLQNYPNNKSLFYIEIDSESGVASVVASDSDDNYKILKYRAYSGGNTTGNRRFGCTNTATDEHHDVAIYKLVGKKGSVPTADAVISVPDEDEPVVIPVEGVAEATVFEDVKFTYVGSWNIEVSTDAEWLTLNYADGVLKYLVGANPGAVREAKVTIKASHEGKETKTFEFNVVQKGAPVKVTVAEFLKKEADANVEYEVTGILSQRPSSSASSTVKIKDAAGNEAQFVYVYMPDNTTSLYANDKIQVNDIVTIVASVVSTGKGGSSNAHAICKGYYNISATAEKDLVGYEGGSVKLNLKKVGTLIPYADITCSANADFAEVAYTANAEEATVTLAANDGAPRQVVATFSDGLASTSVTIVQGADTAKGNTWELVTDASTLAVGDQVIVAAATYDVAMGKTISSGENRPGVDVTKLGNYYLTPNADVLTLVLGKGSVDGTFVFYDAVNEGYLVSSSTSTSTYKLKNQTFIDANTSYAISIDNDIATIGNKEGTYSSCKFGYRASTYKYFFSGASTSQEKVCLYRLVGVKGSIPVTPADVTVPTKSVVVPEEGATEAITIDDVKFNYVGDWNISASAEVDWITFAFDKATNKLTYTALANEGTVRETTATITASMEGQESKSWTFGILQKGKPMEITCDALNDKEQDLNVSYKLTGKVTSIASSSGGTFMLDDGSGRQAEIRYLYTDDNSKQVYNNTDIGLAVGDVVTVTTTVYTKGKGGHSSYHSTYKGHYRLTATPSTTLVSHEGGAATIALATEGNLQPADAVINGAIVEGGDFVTFDYTPGAATATAAFAANAGAPRNAEFKFTFGLATVSVKIGQLNNPSVKVGWYLVTDVNELAVGDKVIIAGKSIDGTKDYAVKKYTSSNPSTTPAIEVELQGNALANVEGVEQYTLEVGHADYSGTWAFKCDSYSRYLNITSGSLKLASSLAKEGSWTIDIASDGKTTLVSKTTNSKTTVMFNDASGTKSFTSNTPSTTGKGAIYIYKYYNSLAQ